MTAPKRPGNPPESPSGTVVMGPAKPEREEGPPSVEVAPGSPGSDDAPGGTAFVRLDAPGVPPRRGAPQKPQPLAPRKGLQVQLPDDEPAPPPPPPKRVIPKPADKKGRRGAWWDEESPKLPDDEDEGPKTATELPPVEAELHTPDGT